MALGYNFPDISNIYLEIPARLVGLAWPLDWAWIVSPWWMSCVLSQSGACVVFEELKVNVKGHVHRCIFLSSAVAFGILWEQMNDGTGMCVCSGVLRRQRPASSDKREIKLESFSLFEQRALIPGPTPPPPKNSRVSISIADFWPESIADFYRLIMRIFCTHLKATKRFWLWLLDTAVPETHD